jgi:putative membrane protein
MGWYHDGSSAWWLMLLLMVTWVVAVLFVVQALWSGRADRPLGRRSAQDVLDDRLARGEISVEEYRERLEALRHGRG